LESWKSNGIVNLKLRKLKTKKKKRKQDAIGFDDDDDDSEAGELDRNNDSPSAFPSGGKAIGMVTWAVQQQEIQDRTKRKQKQQQQQQRKMRHDDEDESLLCEEFVANGWETASVDSWTSHTAIAAGKVATALGSGRRGASHPNPSSEIGERMVIDCASSEDGRVEEDESEEGDEDDLDHFRASILRLTEAEKNSPLGVSMRLTWDMIRYMHGVIAETRASKQVQQPHLPQKVPSARPCISETKTPPRAAAAATTTMQQKHPPPEPSLSSSTNSHLLAAIAANGAPPANLMEALGGAVFGNLGKEASALPPPPSALPSAPALPATTTAAAAASSAAAPFLVTPLSQPVFTTTEWDLARPPSTAPPTF